MGGRLMYIIPLPVTVSPPVGVVSDIISGFFSLIMALRDQPLYLLEVFQGFNSPFGKFYIQYQKIYFSFQSIGITNEQGMHYIAHLIHSVEYDHSSSTSGLCL